MATNLQDNQPFPHWIVYLQPSQGQGQHAQDNNSFAFGLIAKLCKMAAPVGCSVAVLSDYESKTFLTRCWGTGSFYINCTAKDMVDCIICLENVALLIM